MFGASSETLAQEYYDAAWRLGCCMAAGGHTLVFGGGAHGLMGAAARGISGAGGELIGIAPKFFDEPGILFEQCTRLILTDSISHRKAAMEDAAEAFIIAPGGIGTLEEFFEVLTLKQLGRHSKPMALLNTLNYFDPFISAMKLSADGGFMAKGGLELFGVCGGPEEALKYVLTSKPVTGSGYNLEDYAK